MMKTKYSILFFAFLWTITLHLNSCKPDASCPGATSSVFNFTSAELGKVPYSGSDTLYFLSKTGDTNIVVGGGKQFYYDTEYGGTSADCPQNRNVQHQAYKINFTPIKGDLKLKIVHQATYLTIQINDYPIDFVIESSLIGAKNNSIYHYIDSLKINGINYYNIQSLSSYNTYEGLPDNTYLLNYNIAHGVLLIQSQKDNEEYSIIKK